MPTAFQESLLAYWRNSLADAERRSLDKNAGPGFPLSRSELAGGRLSAETLKQLRGGIPNVPEGEDPWPIPLQVAPFGLRRRSEHGVPRHRAGEHLPLFIPARVERDGSLAGDPGAMPWIGRRYLEPISLDVPLLGAVGTVDTFLTHNPAPAETSWESYRQFADALLRATYGHGLVGLEVPDYETLGAWALILDPKRGISQAILDLYDHLRSADVPLPALLATLIAGDPANRAPASEPSAAATLAARHLGQMGSGFPLTPSQRRALHETLRLPEGALLAVNGPPGTGKTTLLQSVVATLWVESALAGQRPAALLGCSTNNRAIQNILDSFAAATRDAASTDPFAARWLPGLDSYGLYFPASTRRGKPSYLEALSRGEGFPAEVERREFVERAQEGYLASARRALPDLSQPSVETVVEALHRRLREGCATLSQTLDLARAVQGRRTEHGGEGPDARTRLENQLAALHRDQTACAALTEEAARLLGTIPFWEDLLAFLPPVRERRNRRLRLLLASRELPFALAGTDLVRAFEAGLEDWRAAVRSRRMTLDRWQDAENAFQRKLGDLGAGRPELASPIAAALADPMASDRVLDPTLRHHLFSLAGRYWEGRWLLEVAPILEEKSLSAERRRERVEQRLARYAMLTPCFVATFHRAPKVFNHFSREQERNLPLTDFFDLLIVDEAGQVSPEVGAATFALAKRALVVGDIHQIEPVWGLTPSIDHANQRRFGLDPRNPDHRSASASEGSLMFLARRATAASDESSGGLLLTEHRRSVPEIVRYPNDLVYQGRLQPLRPAKTGRILPALGWAHVTSPMESRGGSRVNRGEAQVIARWLAAHQQEIERHYEGRNLAELVAIITPFAAQKAALARALAATGLPDVPAGTVHAFQGGERPIVIFSSVYAAAPEPPGPLFFDAGPNLLNVAVTRAKDSFLFFGDVRLLEPRSATPSGKLAHLLFERPEQEIVDVESAQRLDRPGTRRVATLAEHRSLLARALAEGQSRVLIVSPYLTLKAVEQDGIPGRLQAARSRGVEVALIYCPSLSAGPGWRTPEAARLLAEAGAEVLPSSRVHSKTLAVDQSWIVEGSFNWLSASRVEGGVRQSHEVSLFYDGPEVKAFIAEAWKEIATFEPAASRRP